MKHSSIRRKIDNSCPVSCCIMMKMRRRKKTEEEANSFSFGNSLKSATIVIVHTCVVDACVVVDGANMLSIECILELPFSCCTRRMITLVAHAHAKRRRERSTSKHIKIPHNDCSMGFRKEGADSNYVA